MLRTRHTETFKLDHPVISAGVRGIVNGIVGEAIGLIRDIAPAGKILQGMVNEAEAILRNRPSAWLSE